MANGISSAQNNSETFGRANSSFIQEHWSNARLPARIASQMSLSLRRREGASRQQIRHHDKSKQTVEEQLE
jgi:hypothetical protein